MTRKMKTRMAAERFITTFQPSLCYQLNKAHEHFLITAQLRKAAEFETIAGTKHPQ